MIDLTVTLSRPAKSIDELLAPLRAAAASRLSGVLCVIDQELVSSDFLGFPQSTIIDAPATIMLSPTVFKVSPFSFRPASPRPRSFARIDSQGGGRSRGNTLNEPVSAEPRTFLRKPFPRETSGQLIRTSIWYLLLIVIPLFQIIAFYDNEYGCESEE